MEISELKAYGAGSRLMEILSSLGQGPLYPPQEEAVKAGVLKMETSFVISAPTAALNAFTGRGFLGATKCIYLVPLRALAREKFDDFSKKYNPFGLRVTQSTGDFDSADPWLAAADIIITTNEKLDSLIRHRAPWLKDVRLVISDEIHLLGDSHRGPTLEVVLTRLRSLNRHLRVIALSATIPNALELARWLDATLIQSSWRPVPLKEGVFFNGAAIFDDGTVKWIREEALSDVVDLAVDTIREKGQALIFVGTRRSAEAVAAKARKYVFKLSTPEENEALKALSEDVLEASPEPTRIGKKLAETVAEGVAFHHAGIIYQQRKIIEDAFRANRIKLMVSTTTLAMGLNLPSRRVIIRDWWRYLPGAGMQAIPAIEVKQMSGRAGRPGYDSYGESVIVARNKRDEKYLFDRYIKGEVEDIKSQLANESALRTHILAAIAGTFASSRQELIEFLAQTFFAYQMGTDHLSSITDSVLGFLQSEKMVEAMGAASGFTSEMSLS
jgi:helicase